MNKSISFLVFCLTLSRALPALGNFYEKRSCSSIEGYIVCVNGQTLLSVSLVPTDSNVNQRFLVLRNPNITEIAEYAFESMSLLEYLDLDLTPGVLTLRLQSFSGLKALRSLRISSIIILQDNLFKSVRNIRTLWIHYDAKKQTLSEGFPELNYLQEFGITETEFGHLDYNQFRNLYLRMTYLCFSKNLIKSIKAETFWKMTNLWTLKFQENKLETIEPDAFTGLDRLETILIHEESYQTVEKGVFNRLAELRILNFNRSNISRIADDAFAGLQLRELQLGFNSLTDLDRGMTRGLEVLNLLNLEYNQISTVPKNFFNRMPRLKNLLLAGNKISHIEFAAFSGPAFMLVDLKSNRLNEIPLGSLQNLNTKILNVQKNSIRFIEVGALERAIINTLCFDYYPLTAQVITTSLQNTSEVVTPTFAVSSEVCFFQQTSNRTFLST